MVTSAGNDPLSDRRRLRAIEQTGLVPGHRDEALERLARIANRLIRTPVTLVSLVDDERQFFPAAVGLDEPWATLRSTPLSHSFCKHVVRSGLPMAIPDARIDARVAQNAAIQDLGVLSYLGVPLRAPDGEVLGALCVIDHNPRNWGIADYSDLGEVASAVIDDLGLRIQSTRQRIAAETAAHELRSSIAALNLELTAAHGTAADAPTDAAISRAISLTDRASAAIGRLEHVSGPPRHADVQDLEEVLAVITSNRPADDGPPIHLVPGDCPPPRGIAVPADALGHALQRIVDTFRQHGEGPVRIVPCLVDRWVRIRVERHGARIPAAITKQLMRRRDHQDSGDEEPSLAEWVAHRLQGRVVIAPSEHTVFELLFPSELPQP